MDPVRRNTDNFQMLKESEIKEMSKEELVELVYKQRRALLATQASQNQLEFKYHGLEQRTRDQLTRESGRIATLNTVNNRNLRRDIQEADSNSNVAVGMGIGAVLLSIIGVVVNIFLMIGGG